MSTIGGTWFVMPTAFSSDGALDLASQRQLTEGVLEWGVDGVVTMGVTGEASSLHGTEREDVLKAVFESANGRVPIAVGCSASSSHVVLRQIAQARSLGAAAAMVSAPPLLKNLDRLPAFFSHVSTEGGLPLIIQDDPASTAVTIPTTVLVECLRASGSDIVKLEDPPTPPKIARLLEIEPRLHLFGGLGGLSALSEMRRGASGTMTGFAYPEILRAVRIAAEQQDWARAGSLFDRYLPLIAFEAQPGVGLAIRKEILRRRRVLATNVTRAFPPLDDVTLSELDELLDRLKTEPSNLPFEPAEWT